VSLRGDGAQDGTDVIEDPAVQLTDLPLPPGQPSIHRFDDLHESREWSHVSRERPLRFRERLDRLREWLHSLA
jgi:hypothetical protein